MKSTIRSSCTIAFVAAAFSLFVDQPVEGANTANNFTGGATASLLGTGNWSLNALPLVGNDAVFTASSAAGIHTLTAGNLTVGSFDVTATTGTYSIRNETTTSTDSILTLGGSGDNGNGISGTAADLLYVASGATFNLTGPNGSTGSGQLKIALGQSGNFNAVGTMAISSAISGSGFGITKTGAGALTLSGANIFTGPLGASAGTLKLGNAGAWGSGGNNSSGVTISGTAILDFAGFSPAAVPLIMNSSANNFDIGAIENTSGTAVTFGGAVTLQRQTRFGGGGAMLFTGSITGGGFTLIKDSTGLLELQSSGTVTLGAFQANRGTLQVDAGTTLNVTSIDVGTGSSVGAGLTLNGGSVTSSGLSRFGNGSGSASGSLTLTSGTLTVPALTKGGVTFNANFNGGTLKASGNSTTFFPSATLAKVQAGGAVIDDGGFAITIAQPLTDTVATGGGLTKQGAGTLTLSGANTYVGATTISAGTLKVGNAAALGFGGLQTTTTGGTTVGNGFTLDINGTTINEPITINGTGIGGNGALINSSGTAATIGSGIAGATVAATGSGSGYSAAPTVVISGTGSSATATASLGLTAASFTAGATGSKVYSVAPTVTISGGGGSGATATAVLTSGQVTGITITSAGIGYTTAPTLALSGGTVTSGTTDTAFTGNATKFTVGGLTMTAAGTGYTGTPTFTINGSAATATATLSSVVLASDSSIGGSGNITINAVISQSGGARSLTKVGAGTLTLAGANTYGGTTTVSAGKLAVTSAQTTTGNLTVSDGANLTVTISGSSQWSPNTLTLDSTTGATLEFNSLTSAALTTAPLNPTTVTANGTTSVNINSASGLVAGNSYKLIANAGSLASYNLVTQPLGVIGTLAISGGALVYTVASISDIWNAAMPGGNWDVGTTANWSGNAINNSPVNTYQNGDLVLFDDTVSGPNTVTVAAAVTPSAVVVNNSSTAYTIASSGVNLIGGGASLTKNGSASLTLSGGVNTYSGATTISGGTVSVSTLANGGSASDLGASANSAGNLTINGATLQYTGAATSSDRLFTIGTSGATLDASGTGALNLNNSGAVVLSGSGPRPVALTGTSTSANTLAPSLADNGGATAVSKSGAGSWTLAGANSYSGATDLSAGTLALSGSGTLGNGSSALTVSGGTLDLGGLTSPTVGAVTISGGTIQNGTLSGSSYAGQSGTISAILAGSGVALTKTTSGILTLSGANTYSGVTTVSAGTLQLQNPSAVANSALQYASGSTLSLRSDANATFLTTGVTAAANKDPFVWNLDVNNQNAGNTGNTLILQKVGQLMGANAFSMSTLNVSGGNGYTLQMGSGAAGTGAINFWNNLTLNSTTAGVTLSIPGGLAVNAAFSYTLPLSGAGNLSLGPLTHYPGSYNLTPTFGGSGTITLNGANNFGAAAGTISTTGTLALNNNGALTGLSTLALTSAVTLDNTSGGAVTISATPAQTWSSDFTFGSPNTTGALNLGSGTVALGANRQITVANSTYGLAVGGVISGSTYGLTKQGPGTLTLSQPNTFSGNTIVGNGTLLVNNTTGSGTGSGPVTVAAGGILGGTGTASGSVTVNGAIAAGASVGTLNTGSQIWNGGGTNLVELNDATGATPGTSPSWDLLNITGTLTIAATSGSKFTIKLDTLRVSDGLPGNADHFSDADHYGWRIATASGGIVGWDENAFTVDSSGFANTHTGAFYVTTYGNSVYLYYQPDCLATTLGSLQVGSTMEMYFTNTSGLKNVQGTTTTNCTIAGTAYDISGQTIGSSLIVTTNSRTDLPPGTTRLVLVASKVDSGPEARVNAQVKNFCDISKSFDPVITTLTVTSGNQVQQRFEGLIAAEHYLHVVNATPGLKWLEVNLNGRVFRLDPLTDGQEVSADLFAAMREGDNNVVILTGGGDVGASALVMITDTASDGMVALPEIVTLALSQSPDGLVLAWPDTLAGWQLQASTNAGAGWADVANAPVSVNGQSTVKVPAASGAQFYRLVGPAPAAAATARASDTGISILNPPSSKTRQHTYDGLLW